MTSEGRAIVARGTSSPRRLIVIGAVALALIGTAPTEAVTGSPTAPPNTTFEVTIDSGSVVAPGGTISFHGTCWVDGFGPTQRVRVRGARRVPLGSGLEPFDFRLAFAVNASTGAFSGSITVPGDAPNGSYALVATCWTQDQLFGQGEQPFTIDGPQITTTTTTTTSLPPLEVHRVPAPAPARPLRGAAELTG
jgi:hypothetical protein